MASQGPYAPASNAVAQTFDVPWDVPANGYSDNSTYASTTTNTITDQSDWHSWDNFGFTIPAGATIDGIVVEFNDPTPLTFGQLQFALTKDNFIAETSWADLAPVGGWDTYGGPTNLHGATWTADEINDPDFGVMLVAIASANVSQTAFFDAIRVTVYYTETTPQQYAYPDADVAAGSWTSTGANLWSVLDETGADDDADYITGVAT